MIELPDKCPHEATGEQGQCKLGFVYVAQIGDTYKIGYTAKTLHLRMLELARNQRMSVYPKLVFRCHCAPSMEKALHEAFKTKRARQWTLYREYFKLNEEDLAALDALTHYGGKELGREPLLTTKEDRIEMPRKILNKLRAGLSDAEDV
jgi:hypothetical protein